jgi:hypothetical protein
MEFTNFEIDKKLVNQSLKKRKNGHLKGCFELFRQYY